MSKTSKTYSQERRNYSMAERKDDLREGRKNDTHAMQNHANWKVFKKCCKEHAACKMRSSSAKWQVSATMSKEKNPSDMQIVCATWKLPNVTHTQIRCFQLPRTRVKTPCPVDSRHFLRTSGTVSCKMLQIRYFSLNMASKSVQNTDSSSKMLQLRCSQKIQGSKRCKYRANRRFRVHNVANTEEIRDS